MQTPPPVFKFKESTDEGDISSQFRTPVKRSGTPNSPRTHGTHARTSSGSGIDVTSNVSNNSASESVEEMFSAMSGQFYTLSLCTGYMFIGPGLILLNKYILSSLDFPYPMFLSGLGVLVSGLAAQLAVRLGFVVLQRKEQVEGVLWYKRVLPVGLAHAGTLAFGNIVYLFLNVGFIQMLKSFTPVIMMITGVMFKIENPSQTTIFSVSVISIGTAAACTFTTEMNVTGLLVMFMAEATEAIRLLMTQFLLQNLKFGVVEGQYVIAPASAFWLFLASGVFEFGAMVQNDAFSIIAANPGTFLVASFLGLGVNFLSYLVIQATSSLTMKVLGTARNVLTILLGVLFYGETVSVNEGLGYSLALAGFAGYNASKSGWNIINFMGFVPFPPSSSSSSSGSSGGSHSHSLANKSSASDDPEAASGLLLSPRGGDHRGETMDEGMVLSPVKTRRQSSSMSIS